MFDALFGAGMPLTVRFFLAFLIVLGLIGGAAWSVRRFGAGRLGTASMRGRQPRLAVIDYASVDARRRLILVRRDNVEHLLMIGGPTDVVVEPNIVRAGAPRDIAPSRAPMATEPPRAIPVPENDSWPLQPEPAAMARSSRVEPIVDEPTMAPQYAEPAPRAPRESLAALAEEIAARPVPPRNRAAAPARPHYPAEPRMEPRVETRLPAADNADGTTAADQSLAEMAQRLEAALRKPKSPGESRDGRPPAAAARPAPPPPERIAEEAEDAPALPPPPAPLQRAPRSVEARPRADVRTADVRTAEVKTSQGKVLYDSLEQEMASLLGRPAGKT